MEDAKGSRLPSTPFEQVDLFSLSFFLSFFLVKTCIPDREREREREKRRLMNIQKRSRGEVSRRQVDSTKKIELLERKREKYKGR